MAMSKQQKYGNHEGKAVHRITLESPSGIKAEVITFGARLTQLHVPDRQGQLADIVLGFDTLEEYVATDTFFGATCGRYGNRIAGGQFQLMDDSIQLDINEGANQLHGGTEGFDRKVWDIVSISDSKVVLGAISEDGEMGFPGRCELKTTYELTDNNKLIILMEADTDKLTVMNMVNHAYFNLAGHGSGPILDQQIRLAGRFYTPVDGELLATGEILAVADTPFDFHQLKAIGKDIADLQAPGAGVFDEGGGYDHNWCLDDSGEQLRDCAEAFDPASGRRMSLRTTEPGVQFYTGGYLSDAIVGKQGQRLCKYAGFTLETQVFPGTPNFAHFPDCRLAPGEHYRQEMVFEFTTD